VAVAVERLAIARIDLSQGPERDASGGVVNRVGGTDVDVKPDDLEIPEPGHVRGPSYPGVSELPLPIVMLNCW
jgi:hypothetical protein